MPPLLFSDEFLLLYILLYVCERVGGEDKLFSAVYESQQCVYIHEAIPYIGVGLRPPPKLLLPMSR